MTIIEILQYSFIDIHTLSFQKELSRNYTGVTFPLLFLRAEFLKLPYVTFSLGGWSL